MILFDIVYCIYSNIINILKNKNRYSILTTNCLPKIMIYLFNINHRHLSEDQMTIK